MERFHRAALSRAPTPDVCRRGGRLARSAPRAALAAAALMAAPHAVLAEEANTVAEVEVMARKSDLSLTEETTAGGRLGLSALETPASVSVLSGDVIRDLRLTSVALAKTLAPGVTSANSPGNGGNSLISRGFAGVNSVKQLYNGLEIYNAGGVVSFPFDPWNVERIETLYGPASVLYGTGAIGGAVNVVPLRPDPAAASHRILLAAGSFNTLQQAIDSTGPLGAGFSYRVTASHVSSDHWVERGDLDTLALSASLRFDATDDLSFVLSNDYGRQNPSQYLGTPLLNGRPAPGTERKNYNLSDAELYFFDNWTTLDADWKPSEAISVHNSAYLLQHDRQYRDVTAFTFVPAAVLADSTVRRTSFRDIGKSVERQWGDTGYVKLSAPLFGFKNEFLVGFDINRTTYNRHDNVRGGASVVNAYNFTPGDYRDFYQQESKPFYFMTVNQRGAFMENRLSLGDNLSLVAGLRADHYEVKREDRVIVLNTSSTYDAISGNLGIVYNPVPSLAIYGQVATASDPVNSLASINANQQGFNLSDGNQIEFGLKQSLWGQTFEWTLAAYKIVKKDLLTTSVTNPTLTEQVGQQSSRGIEASAALRLSTVRLNVNGTVLDPQFDDFPTAVGGRVVNLKGYVPLTVPKQTANAIVFWDVAPDWQLRAAVRHVGKRFADNANVSVMPAYTVADLGASWRANASVKLDLNVENIFDKTYATQGSSTQWILGSPRAVSMAVTLAF